MGRSARRKFLKQEKAKVKLKNSKKELLPKGQNITDLNFKVKKIVLKNQLKDHNPNEVVSRRKLNLKEVLSRVGHYNNHVQSEALSDLEEILGNTSVDFMSNLIPILNNLGKSVVCNFSDSRKKSISLLTRVLFKIGNGHESGLACGAVVPRLVCGLTSLDAAVRDDSVAAVAAVAAACPTATGAALPVLLPSLLGLLAIRTGSGWAPSTPPLIRHPVPWRTKIIATIAILLKNYVGHSEQCADESENLSGPTGSRNGHFVKYVPTFLRPSNSTQLDLGFSTASLQPASKKDWKEEARILVSVTLDAFSEALGNSDIDVNGLVVSQEVCALLESAAGMMIALWNLLISQDPANEHWFSTQFSSLINSRLISGKFPYHVVANQGKGRRQKGPGQESATAELANARVALLGLAVARSKPYRLAITDHLPTIASAHPEFAQALLIAVRSDPSCLEFAGPDSMRCIARDPTLYHLHNEASFVRWSSNLVKNLNSCTKSDILLLLHLASLSRKCVIDALDKYILSILENINGHPEAEEVVKFLYRVEKWDGTLLNGLQCLIDNSDCPSLIKESITYIVHAKSQTEKKLRSILCGHSWWYSKIKTV